MPCEIMKRCDIINKLRILGEDECRGDPSADHISQERVRLLDFSAVRFRDGTDQGEGLLGPLQHLVEQLEVDGPEDLVNGGLDLGPGSVKGLNAQLLV
jgi:hypothetical protein